MADQKLSFNYVSPFQFMGPQKSDIIGAAAQGMFALSQGLRQNRLDKEKKKREQEDLEYLRKQRAQSLEQGALNLEKTKRDLAQEKAQAEAARKTDLEQADWILDTSDDDLGLYPLDPTSDSAQDSPFKIPGMSLTKEVPEEGLGVSSFSKEPPQTLNVPKGTLTGSPLGLQKKKEHGEQALETAERHRDLLNSRLRSIRNKMRTASTPDEKIAYKKQFWELYEKFDTSKQEYQTAEMGDKVSRLQAAVAAKDLPLARELMREVGKGEFADYLDVNEKDEMTMFGTPIGPLDIAGVTSDDPKERAKALDNVHKQLLTATSISSWKEMHQEWNRGNLKAAYSAATMAAMSRDEKIAKDALDMMDDIRRAKLKTSGGGGGGTSQSGGQEEEKYLTEKQITDRLDQALNYISQDLQDLENPENDTQAKQRALKSRLDRDLKQYAYKTAEANDKGYTRRIGVEYVEDGVIKYAVLESMDDWKPGMKPLSQPPHPKIAEMFGIAAQARADLIGAEEQVLPWYKITGLPENHLTRMKE